MIFENHDIFENIYHGLKILICVSIKYMSENKIFINHTQIRIR